MSQVVALFHWSFAGLNSFRTRQITAMRLIVTCAIASALFYNITLWVKLLGRFGYPLAANMLFLANMLILMIAANIFLLSLIVQPRIAKSLLAVWFICCAMIAHFNDLGVVVDEQMVKNIVQTDAHEAYELLVPGFWFHLVTLGLIPAFIVSQLKIGFSGPVREAGSRVLLLAVIALASVALFYVNYRHSTYFARENRDLRWYINPLFPLLSMQKVYASQTETAIAFRMLGGDAVIAKNKPKKTVGIMIVGETARADHFQLNGYGRDTNPRLSQRRLLNFNMATSCGTSTAYSVPCMFSFMGAANYDPDLASHQSNVLDVLRVAGVQAFWRDNNSSCKGVCSRSATENFRNTVDPKSVYFNDGEYFDEILLSGLRDYIARVDGDALIVLHPLGSHGPAYFRRYPREFQQFTPACENQDPSQCGTEEINNSYDNTILYADYFIDSAIELMEGLQDEVDSFVFYVSDHGESLGENGVYLHGLPRAIAPIEQTHVPFFLWLSPGLNQEFRIDRKAPERCSSVPVSHDNISHTLLGLFQVDTQIRNPELNLLSNQCIKQ